MSFMRDPVERYLNGEISFDQFQQEINRLPEDRLARLGRLGSPFPVVRAATTVAQQVLRPLAQFGAEAYLYGGGILLNYLILSTVLRVPMRGAIVVAIALWVTVVVLVVCTERVLREQE